MSRKNDKGFDLEGDGGRDSGLLDVQMLDTEKTKVVESKSGSFVDAVSSDLNSSKTIDANESLFQVSSVGTDVKKGGLASKIMSLIGEWKLTEREVVEYFVQISSKHYLAVEIEKELDALFMNHRVTKVEMNQEMIVKPSDLSVLCEQAWERIRRDTSRRWIKNRLFSGNKFQRSSKIFNQLVKINSYNQVYQPTENQSVVLKDTDVCVMFSSNDYLGLSKNKDICECVKQAIDKYGHGSGGSRILSGTTPEHRNLEKKIARFKSADDAIVFGSGFMTNLGLFSLFQKDWVVIYDNLSHTSIVEGLKMTQSTGVKFRHNDVEDLRSKLEQAPKDVQLLIVVEGVYSMDGDIGHIDEFYKLAKEYHALLAVDEAHSLGTVGATGRGVAEHFNLPDDAIDFKVGTLGKAVGAMGGYIAGNQHIIDILRYSANSFLFSTSLPASTMAGAIKAFDIIESDTSYVQLLQKRSQDVRERLIRFGFDIGLSETHIIPIVIPDIIKLEALQEALKKEGMLVNLVTFPAVSRDKSRLRINISAGHTDEQIELLLKHLEFYSEKLGIVSQKEGLNILS